MTRLTPPSVFEGRYDPDTGAPLDVEELRPGHERFEYFELRRREDGRASVLVCINSVEGELPQDLVYHSPDGFEWGYGGSGPADLALNILACFLVPPLAWRLHQAFKWDVVALVPTKGAGFPAEAVRQWIRAFWRLRTENPDAGEHTLAQLRREAFVQAVDVERARPAS